MWYRYKRMELFIENINHTGEGVARHAGKVVFVAYAIPGETVRVELTEEKKHYCRGIVKDIITESPYRVEAKCPHYYHCGGCSFQHIEYKEQLLLKQKIMEDILKRMAGVDSLIKPVIGMKEPWYYRNKVVWHLTQEGNSKKIGFYRFRSRQLVEIDHCPLLLPKLNKVSLLIKEMLSEVKVMNNSNNSYDSSVMIRQSNQQDGMMLIFNNCSVGEKLLRKLEGEVPSIYEQQEGKLKLLSGQKWIRQRAGQCLFYLGPHDFFQVNAEQNERLIDTIFHYLHLTGEEKVLDAYCGVGTFSLNVGRYSASVVGIDSNHLAIREAKRNALLNGLENCHFISGYCEEILPAIAIKEQFNRVIVDPPRAGLQEEVTSQLSSILPEILEYVSCNPATLSRDVKQFLANGYQLVEVQPIDMFPQTNNIENVVFILQMN
ncbi:MAG: 23S rRNA (uracil(1939)-C(5))-methyltransferase RlmD [Candidatus Caldatribacteriota bacterium]